ncbi:MAG: hypothetical protein E6R04_01160 [Spirochaetes bacterium]|nr:MAG: hypothetical protein E6R04_01160 [Spirochaetota bacterium]
MATLTKEQWKELRNQKVVIRNKFGGYFMGNVGHLLESKVWKNRVKVLLYSVDLLAHGEPYLGKHSAFRRCSLKCKKKLYVAHYNGGTRSFFIDDADVIHVNPQGDLRTGYDLP